MDAKITIKYKGKIGKNRKQIEAEFLAEHADEIVYEINEKLAIHQYNKALEITKSAIDSFYSDYNPHLYNRTGSLYDIFDIQVSGDDFIFAIDDDLMGWHRSNEAVMQLDIMQGFHGGKKWRTPPVPGRNVRIEGNVTAWADHSWQYWHPDTSPINRNRSVPPYERILKRWNFYIENEYENYKKKLLVEVIGKYRKMAWR